MTLPADVGSVRERSLIEEYNSLMIMLLGAVFQLAHDSNPSTPIWSGEPAFVGEIVAVVLAVAALIAKIDPLASAVASVARFLVRLLKLGNREEAYRIGQRRLFASHVESQLDQLARREDWRDSRFAELEAEVEAEGRERVLSWLWHSPSRAVTLRRERSLSVALDRSAERLIVLEGDPGSGKSVALRHLAHALAKKACHSRSVSSRIPLYVNLKEFNPPRRPVDSEAVRDFILESLKRTNDRNIDRFLDEEFDRGLTEGTWLLLLDSFDEIPDVLSATEATGAVEEYAQAIYDFLHGMKTVRAVVASREFRGPNTFRVPRFRVMPLSARRQRDLVRRSGLRPEAADAVYAGLSAADSDLQQMARNPLFLGLICEHVRTENHFPDSAHSAYESYFQRRLTVDEERIRRRYRVDPGLMRRIVEEVAFSMGAVPGIGLSAGRRQLHAALAVADQISFSQFDKALDALEYVKLGWSPGGDESDPERRFTFAHRRFQEYFATCVVLRDPGRVPVREMLTSGQWREAAVTILQTQAHESAVAEALVGEAGRLLDGMVAGLAPEGAGGRFPWPPGCLHLLQLLDIGRGRSPAHIPEGLRESAGEILRAAWRQGRRYDRKWAVEAASVADHETTLWLIEQAFGSGSVLLAGTGYAVVSRMTEPPDRVYGGVRRALIDMAASGQLAEERVTLKAQVRRLPSPRDVLRVLRLLAEARKILAGLAVVIATANFFLYWPAAVFDVIAFPASLSLFRAAFSRSGDGRSRASYEVLVMLAILACQIVVEAHVLSLYPARWLPALVVLGLSFFYVTWPFAVRAACSAGRMTAPVFWVLIPVYYILYGFWRSMRPGRLLFQRKVVLGFIALLIIVAVEESIPVGKLPALRLTAVAEYLLFAVVAVLGVAVVSPIFAVIVLAVAAVRRRWRDRAVVGGLAADVQRADAPEFLRALHRVRTARAMNKILHLACSRDAAGAPGILRVLSDLSAVVEARRRDEDASVSGLDSRVEEWLRADPEASRRVVWSVKEATLDRIASVVERAELARQVSRGGEGDSEEPPSR